MTIPAVGDVITTALRSFLMNLFSEVKGFEAMKSQANRVAMGTGDRALMTPLFSTRKSTTAQFYDPIDKTVTLYEIQFIDVQVDMYGTHAFDNAFRLETIFRSGYAYDLMKTFTNKVVPISSDSVKQAPIINGQDAWEHRYIVTLTLQVINPQTLPQTFFDKVEFKSEAQ